MALDLFYMHQIERKVIYVINVMCVSMYAYECVHICARTHGARMCIVACWTTEEASCLSAMNCRTVSSLRRAAAPRSFSVLMTAAKLPKMTTS